MYNEDDIKKRPDFEIGQNLEEMSVEELAQTIQVLTTEIERLELVRQQKTTHLNAAQALFSKPG